MVRFLVMSTDTHNDQDMCGWLWLVEPVHAFYGAYELVRRTILIMLLS